MAEQVDDAKRAVRTALRLIRATEDNPPKDEPCQHMAAALQQLAFAVNKLADLMARSAPTQD